MTIIKVGVFISMLLITPMLVAQNTTVSLWEENLEQLSMDGEERNWEDELEELSFPDCISNRTSFGVCVCAWTDADCL